MYVPVGKINCYLCSKTADILPHVEAAAISRIQCQNCGEYLITVQAIHVLELSINDIKYILSSQTFENYYYEHKPLTIKTEHIENAKDIPTSEKLYKLSKYLYHETEKRGLGTEIDVNSSQFFCRNNNELFKLMDTLKSMNIIEFDKYDSPCGAKGSYNSNYGSPKLLGKVILLFEGSIKNFEDFKEFFMNAKRNGNQVINVIKNGNNQFNQAFDNGNITATQNNSLDIKELNKLIENILSSLPQDIDNKVRVEVKENLAVIQSEVQSPSPRKIIIKNTLNALKGIATTTGFLASLAKLVEFLQF